MRKTYYKLILYSIAVFTSHNCFAQRRIDTLETVLAGGIKQVVTLQGENRSKPLFLFITGGPGNEGIYDENKNYLDELKKHFVVIAWDQRNCGQTLKLNPSPEKLTVKLYENDTHELVSALLKQFHQKKMFIMGWSWGTVLGFYMAGQHPEQVYAYMTVSPAVNQWESERLNLNEMKQKAEKQKNKQAIDELSKVQIPFKNGEQNYYDRKWLTIFNGDSINDTTEFKKYFTENPEMTALFDEANNINLTVSMPKIKCPVYFFVGRKDHQTNYMISEKYYEQLKAPKKGLFWFEKSGHLIPVTEPKLLQEVVITKILPQIRLEN
ncbi:pimeloyl-ACP methyl ester carboxylesterase [Mucilaginibacter gracilis]|uniref:Pimeloyl-ACP methyl ester carboxylesterase n=1 Tax=Mucilaginibacter gracilis TaxID=423350 RepID=A0A495IXZ9_9SPHI|nr:alpha/beta hydrolase [Mucilaginibacter gracilis]RKR80739.1 pimeloyl-ACP methyl ester carboxylesterase [Mucilaginibacter gracilis]